MIYPDVPELTNTIKQHGLKFIHLNICYLMLKCYKGINLISVSESHLLKQVLDAEIAIEGYNIYIVKTGLIKRRVERFWYIC